MYRHFRHADFRCDHAGGLAFIRPCKFYKACPMSNYASRRIKVLLANSVCIPESGIPSRYNCIAAKPLTVLSKSTLHAKVRWSDHFATRVAHFQYFHQSFFIIQNVQCNLNIGNHSFGIKKLAQTSGN